MLKRHMCAPLDRKQYLHNARYFVSKLQQKSQQKFFDAWNLTTEELNHVQAPQSSSKAAPSKTWVPDLCEQGIEPNPGPYSLVSLNAAGSNNAFRAAAHYMGASHTAIALQEVCLSERQTIAMRKKANSFGYDAFFSVPQPTKYSNGADHVHGGVCLLIQRSCRHWLSSTCMCDQGQAVCVDMDAFCLIALYARPVEENTTLHTRLHETCYSMRPHKQWVILGDWNEEPGDSPITTNLQCRGGTPFASLRVPNWSQADGKVDGASTGRSAMCRANLL
jgi:hypothetical protein